MGWEWRSWLRIGLVGITSTTGVTAEEISVFVHDYANLSGRVLQRAESEAGRILGAAGVQVKWVDCPEGREAPPAWEEPPSSTELVIHLLSASATRRDAGRDNLGYAVPPESGPFGSYGGVLCDRVARLSSTEVSDSRLLGVAIRHELGHLLLGRRLSRVRRHNEA